MTLKDKNWPNAKNGLEALTYGKEPPKLFKR